jgi:small-conductance mechanosensitive channel
MIDSPFPPAPLIPSETQKHSRLGIASFVIGLVSLIIFCLAVVLAFGYGVSIASSTPSVQSLESSPTILVFGLMMLVSPFLGLVGAVLGFVAVFQKDKKKLFGILGIVVNLLIVLAFCALLVIGLAGRSGSLGL